ncbi:MAG: hypothetical protein SYC29_00990 [Planctomycetota bacterium]|nr:hypothetical protein [Planctomycetota bacterium]
MGKAGRASRAFVAVAWLGAMGSAAVAEHITDPAYFEDLEHLTIDFEKFPGDEETLPPNTPFSAEYAEWGALFRAEDHPDEIHTTDPEDANGRFESMCCILDAQTNGGVPTSGVRYMHGECEHYNGWNVSDVRIDFDPPTDAFAAYVIDNDFTDVRIAAYDADGVLLESIVVPQGEEGCVRYHGIAMPAIGYVIIDGNNDGPLDSTFIDDLSFTGDWPGPCVGDIYEDGEVNTADLLILLGDWGECPDPPEDCPSDLDANGTVNTADLLLLLGNWGPCE